MKALYRLLAVTLVLGLVLSLVPVTLAAEEATLTFITPTGSTQVTATVGKNYIAPGCTETHEGYTFECWTDRAYEKAKYYEIPDYWYEGNKIKVTGDMTFYAVYYYKENAQTVCYYWSDNLEDYSGQWSFVGFNPNADGSDFDYEKPVALGPEGETISVVRELGAKVDSYYAEFYTNDPRVCFEVARQDNGTYTIRSTVSGKYLSVSEGKVAFVDAVDAYSYWSIAPNDLEYECIFNAKEPDLIFLYDYNARAFTVMDNSVTNEWGMHPSEWLLTYMYGRDPYDHWYTTNPVITSNPDDPTDGECYVKDFNDCTAKWYHEAVDFVVSEGLMKGVAEGSFDPAGTMTRGMIVTVLYREAGSPMVFGAPTFTDVIDGKYYFDAVAWAQEKGIVNGISETEFAPNAKVTREQIATILWRYADAPEAAADMSAFGDASSISSYAVNAMHWAVSEGILKGDNGNLRPKDNATRAEFACMILRYLDGAYICNAE